MPQALNVILMVLLVIGAFILSLFIAGWKMKRACDFILRDLRQRQAFDPASAVEIPYSKVSYFQFGMRDYRPKALEQLLRQGIVQPTEEGRYFLAEPLAAPYGGTAQPGGA